jgi:LmbE family N-acetylglucosaminyl deacetylase
LGAFPQVAPTTEPSWLDWAGTRPPLRVAAARAIVVTPHPDDETLACGGLIADLRIAAVPVTVVAVTDGEGSHPSEPTLRSRRRAEQQRAVAHLGVHHPVIRLGLADSDVESHIEQLLQILGQVVGPDDLLISPWWRDGHADHDACGVAAARTANETGCRLLAYPVWAWQWAQPEDLAAPDWRIRPMSADAHVAKLAAIDEYRTQTTDMFGDVIVDDEMLVRFRRDFEVFADVG